MSTTKRTRVSATPADFHRLLRRAVRRISDVYDQLYTGNKALNAVDDLIPDIDRLRKTLLKIRICYQRGWEQSKLALHYEAIRRKRVLDRKLAAWDEHLQVPVQRPVTPELIHDELLQLREEFDDVTLDLAENMISAVTDPITLDGIKLGRFALQLHIPDIIQLDSDVLWCIALEPNPAASNEHVTHPHVKSRRLCAGEAKNPMKAALRDGRLCDLFMLARSVLLTHEPESSHIKLSQWSGLSCYSCDDELEDDESYTCAECQHSCCSGCISGCGSCCTDYCYNCEVSCDICETGGCPSCVNKCEKCAKTCCRKCISRCDVCDKSQCDDCLTTCESCSFSLCSACGVVCKACNATFCLNCLSDDQMCSNCQSNSDGEQADEAGQDASETDAKKEQTDGIGDDAPTAGAATGAASAEDDTL